MTGYGEEQGTIETGTLTPDAFTFRSTTYSVLTRTSGDLLTVVLVDPDSNSWYPREEVVDALRWHVCNTPYDFSNAQTTTPEDLFTSFEGYRWNVGSIWPPGIERTLRLSLPPNHPATGDPVISGTVQVGEELTALTDDIMDEDVLDDVFTYQWVRVDADGTSNEEDITDETDATYTLTDDERGKKVKVEVRFVDILGGEETRTSAATETVPGVTVSTPALTVTEEDTTGATYTVVLNSQPTANVTVTVAGHAGTDVTPSPTSLTFTTTNWGTAQTVTVTAGDDADTANDAVSLTHSAASTDSDYQGISIDGVAVTVTDNDAAKGVTVSTTALTVTEEDTTGASYTVVLDSQPTATVTVTVAGHAGTDVTPNPTTLTFTSTTWGTAQTVTVTAGADADTANDTVTLTHSATSTDSDYDGISIDGVAVTVTDNDTAQVMGVGVVPGNAQLVVTWTAVSTATGYTVQWMSGGQNYNTGDRQATVTTGSTTRYTIPSLINGTEYTVRVIATRTGANDGPPSDEMTGTPRVPPPPPPPPPPEPEQVTDLEQVMRVTVVPGNAHLVVTWTAVDNATGYTVQWMSSGQGYTTGDRQATVTTGSTTRYTIPSLTNGTEYTVRVIATRTGANDGPPSAEETGTPFTTPGAPQHLSAVAGDAQVTLTWDAPTSDGGSAILRYEVAVDDSGTWIDAGLDLEETVTGLTNGQPYAFAVRAMNAAGTGLASAVTASPVTMPGAPQHLSAVAGDAQVTLTWDAPTSDGGSAILRYEVAVDDSGTWIDAGLDLEETVTGLTNGQPYTFAVRAMNAAGTGLAAEVTASPATMPGAPQHLSAVAGYAQVTLTWDAPSSDGGSAILRYEVAVDDSGTWIDAGLDLEESVTGLTNGQRYTFAVRAVNAAGTGPAATVTIVTSHPLAQAWLARFGRAATDHVVDAVSNRWQGGPQASHLTIGGVQAGALFGWIGRVGQAARDTADDRGDPVRTEASWARLFAPSGGAGTGGGGTGPGMTVTNRNTGLVGLGGVDRKAGATLSGRAAQGALLGALGLPDPRALTDLRAALLGSSFFYSGARDADGQPRTPGGFGEWSAWGRGAASWFSGTDSGLSFDGEVVTAMLGFDSRWDRWRAGVVVSHSRGQGTYTHPTAPGGAVASTLTALHPYAGYEFNERTSIWGVLGYGVGEMSLTTERSVTALETGLMNAMAAVGGRTALSVRSGPARRFELAIRSDARLTNTAADAVGVMVGAAGQTHRVRMMLEGSGVMPLALGGVLKPRLEAGLRYDAGDAETGAGLEAGGGLGYAFGRLSLEVNARGLLAHQDTQYEEWGFSGAVAYTPSEDGRGLSLRLGSGWGATQSGVQSLWRRQDASDLVRHAEFDVAQRYQVELRYVLDGLKGRVRWAPYIGVESGGGSSQALRLGVTLTSGRHFDAGLELGRRQGGPGAGPEHAGQIRATLLW